jgi:hypothetical protein
MGGIDENFKAAGIWLGGDAYCNYTRDFYSNWYDLSGSISGRFNFFVVDHLALSLGVGYSVYSFTNQTTQFLHLATGAEYDFVTCPEAERGIVHSLVLEAGDEIGFLAGGYNIFSFSPQYRFNYFVTERIAPYFLVRPTFNFEGGNRNSCSLYAGIGVGLYFPTSMRVMIKK